MRNTNVYEYAEFLSGKKLGRLKKQNVRAHPVYA
jgi:hypothetical protein